MTNDPQVLSREVADFLVFYKEASSEEERFERGSKEAPFFLGRLSDQAGKMYEKLRNAVDNKEEHFLVRYAIRRIAKRIMWFSNDPEKITEKLLRDLYRSGYLPSGKLSRATEEAVVRSVRAFLVLDRSVALGRPSAEYLRLRTYLLDIFAGMLEEKLYPTYNEEAAVRLLARLADETVTVDGYEISDETRALILYICAWKALFAADQPLLYYKLWTHAHPGWEYAEEADLGDAGKGFRDFVDRAKRLTENRLVKKIPSRLRNLSIAVSAIYELSKRYGVGIETFLSDRKEFAARIKEVVIDNYRSDLSRSSGKAWRAVFYILITKALLALGVESAYVTLLHASVNYVAIGVNILFHPLLLVLLTIWLTQPPRANTERIIFLAESIAYGKPLPKIVVRRSGSRFVSDVVSALYIVLSLGALSWLSVFLYQFGFHAIDIVFFVLFLVLVLYFGFRIRYAARRMELAGGKENFLRTTLELLALPAVSLGRWLVTEFERLNIVAVFMDLFIELPLRSVLEFFEIFSSALKEKKDEIYS